MADLKRVRCTWSGAGVVGPSVSTFYFDSTATGFPANLQTFFQAVKGGLPDDCTITVPNTGDIIADGNGSLNGVWTDSGGSTTTGTATQVFAKGAGARVVWVTSGTRGGRRVLGATFLVPCASTAFTSTGDLDPTYAGVISSAASALVTAQSGHFKVFGKPHSKAAADGQSATVVAAIVYSRASGLRSRRT